MGKQIQSHFPSGDEMIPVWVKSGAVILQLPCGSFSHKSYLMLVAFVTVLLQCQTLPPLGSNQWAGTKFPSGAFLRTYTGQSQRIISDNHDVQIVVPNLFAFSSLPSCSCSMCDWLIDGSAPTLLIGLPESSCSSLDGDFLELPISLLILKLYIFAAILSVRNCFAGDKDLNRKLH